MQACVEKSNEATLIAHSAHSTFRVGTIINPLLKHYGSCQPQTERCEVRVPARIDTFLCKTQHFFMPPSRQIHPVGSINFVISQYTTASVRLNHSKNLEIISANRRPVIMHVALLLQHVLGFREGLTIQADNQHSIIHGGLGSTVSLVAATAIAINRLYGDRLPAKDLLRLLSQNYGEESHVSDILNPVPSIGGGIASALFPANLNIMGCDTGEPLPFHLPASYQAVLFMPKIHYFPSGEEDRHLTARGIDRLNQMGLDFGAQRKVILHDVIIPQLKHHDVRALFEHINRYTTGGYGDIPEYFENRWKSSGIHYRQIIQSISQRLFSVFKDNECCFFVSSAGPLIAVITQDAQKVKQLLSELDHREIFDVALHSAGAIFTHDS